MDCHFIPEHDGDSSSNSQPNFTEVVILKLATLTITATFLMLPAMAVAQLGPSNQIVTEVPFQFMVGTRTVPAGTYIVRQAYEDSIIFAIENAGAKVYVGFLVNHEEKAQTGQGTSLIFHQYGDRYFLNGIRLNEGIIERLSESKAEAELRARNATAPEEKASIAALK